MHIYLFARIKVVTLHQFSHIFGQMGGVERLYLICFLYIGICDNRYSQQGYKL